MELTIPAAAERAARDFGDRPRWPSRAGRGCPTPSCTSGSSDGGPGAASPAGVGPGDRVAIWAPNTHHWVVGRARRARTPGATLVPVNTRFTGPEALDVIGRSRARALLVAGPFLGTDRLAALRAAAAEAGADLRGS